MRIGTRGDQTRTFIAGISGKTVKAPPSRSSSTPRGSWDHEHCESTAPRRAASAADGRRMMAEIERLPGQGQGLAG